ncbi:MAG: hypothetical protein WC529_06375 [Candidatus Margulisiibacteriota bacterium]
MFKLLGITTYALVLLTLLTGLRRVKLQYHRWIAYAAITAATIHGVLIILFD